MKRLSTAALLLSQSYCFNGPGLFEQDQSASDYAIVAEEYGDGVIGGEVSANSGATQVLSASTSSDIAGASVSFPPGSLSIDTTISMQQGASIATSSLGSQLGVNSGAISAGGPSVVVSSSQKIDATNPFSLEIPLSGGAGLNLGDPYARLIVVYKVERASTGQNYIGVIPRTQLQVTSTGNVSFQTKYFGMYQTAYTEAVITKAVETTTQTAILTKTDESKLEPIEWVMQKPMVNFSQKEIIFSAAVKGFADIVVCSEFVHKQKDQPFIFRHVTEAGEPLDPNNLVFRYRPNQTSLVGSFILSRFECEDTNGRIARSPFSLAVKIPDFNPPQDTAEPTPTPPPSSTNAFLSFTGMAAAAQPSGRLFTQAMGSISLTGTCNPGAGPVLVNGDGIEFAGSDLVGPSTTIPCFADGTFAFSVGYDNSSTADFKLTGRAGGKGFSVKQGSDEIHTIIHKLPAGMQANSTSIVYVGSAAELQSAFNANDMRYFILTADIPLSNPWTPVIGFSGYFDGDGHTISNLTINVPAAGGTSGVGFFATTGSVGAVISHVQFENVTIQAQSALTALATNIGTVVGKVQTSSSGTLLVKVKLIDNNSAISLNSNSSVNDVGGLIGFGSKVTLLHCSSNADVAVTAAAASSGAGGIIGQAQVALLVRVTSEGDVSGKDNVGGIVGEISGASSVKESAALGVVSGGDFVGGLAGFVDIIPPHKISASMAAGNIGSGMNQIGGLIGGLNEGTVEDSYATGHILAGAGNHRGGLIGQTGAISGIVIQRTYATGNINGGVQKCGGLVGWVANASTMISDTFAIGEQNCSNYKSAVANAMSGFSQSNIARISGTNMCFNNGGIQSDSCMIVGDVSHLYNSTFDLYNSSNPANWAGTPWEFHTNSLPTLKWMQ